MEVSVVPTRLLQHSRKKTKQKQQQQPLRNRLDWPWDILPTPSKSFSFIQMKWWWRGLIWGWDMKTYRNRGPHKLDHILVRCKVCLFILPSLIWTYSCSYRNGKTIKICYLTSSPNKALFISLPRVFTWVNKPNVADVIHIPNCTTGSWSHTITMHTEDPRRIWKKKKKRSAHQIILHQLEIFQSPKQVVVASGRKSPLKTFKLHHSLFFPSA